MLQCHPVPSPTMSQQPTTHEPFPSNDHPLEDHTTQPKSRWPFNHNTVTPAQLLGLASAEPPVKPEDNRPGQGQSDTAPGSRRGPPVRFDDQKRRLFFDLIRYGFTKGKAARLVGISPRRVQEAAQNDPLFAGRIHEAVFEFYSLTLDSIARAGQKNWRAAAWLLDRTRTKRGPGRPRSRSLLAQPELRSQLEQIVRNLLLEVMPHLRQESASAYDPISAIGQTDDIADDALTPDQQRRIAAMANEAARLRDSGRRINSDALWRKYFPDVPRTCAQSKARQFTDDADSLSSQLESAQAFASPLAPDDARITAQNP
jgi:hypothetical protein